MYYHRQTAAPPFAPSPRACPCPPGRLLDRTFFARSSDLVAGDLIGKILWREGVGGGRLTEVEAYLPTDDPACHAHRGQTSRNASMFGPPGTIYVYLSYGVHVLLNLVCEGEGVGSAVLVRSFDPLGSLVGLRRNRERASRARTTAPVSDLAWLSCGPGRVGQALGLRLDMDGLRLGPDSGMYVVDDGFDAHAVRCRRVGISKGDLLPLRFCAAESAYVTHKPRTTGGHSE